MRVSTMRGPEDYNPDEDESFDYDAIYYGEEEPTEDHGGRID